jgi:hypothetical protein
MILLFRQQIQPASASQGQTRWVRAVFCLLSSLLLGTGCSSTHHHKDKEAHHLDVSEGIAATAPPLFLVGPISVLLTNLDDFEGHVSAPGGLGTGPGSAPVAGNLFQQSGHILFVPMSDQSPGRGGWAGTFRFLVDVKGGSAFVISEALQGYAPVPVRTRYSVDSTQPPIGAPNREQIDGQSCRQEDVVVKGSDGASASFQTWRMVEESGPPLRIRPIGQTNLAAVNLSELKMEAQVPDLFSPPEGFTKYSSGEAMVHEMAHRQMLMRYRPGFGNEGGSGGRRRGGY